MMVPILTFLFGGTAGFALGRGFSLKKEREMQEEQERLRRQGAQRPAPLPPSDADDAGAHPLATGGPSPLPQDPYRAPLPDAIIHLPVDEEDFEQLKAAICTCYLAVKEEKGPDHLVTAAELRDCLLEAIYPDFAWPPVPGDAVQAQLMWMIADHEARKALAAGELDRCPRPTRLAGTAAGGGDGGGQGGGNGGNGGGGGLGGFNVAGS